MYKITEYINSIQMLKYGDPVNIYKIKIEGMQIHATIYSEL